MYHVVHFLKLFLPIEKEFVLSDQPSQVDQFKLLELLGRLLIGFDHGRAHVHYHHDTEAEYQLDHHLTEHSKNGRHDTEGQLIALLDILVIGWFQSANLEVKIAQYRVWEQETKCERNEDDD